MLLLAIPAVAQEPAAPARRDRDKEVLWTVRPVTACYAYLVDGPFGEPVDVCWDPVAEEVWVADAGKNRVGIYDGSLLPKFSFGGRSVIHQPRRLAVNVAGDLLSLYSRTDALRRFNYRGEWLRDVPVSANGSTPNLSSLDVAPDGSLLVGDAGEGRLVALDPESLEVLWSIGERGAGEGRFLAIAAAAYSPDGEYLYVLDRANEPVVQVFRSSDREFLFGWGVHSILHQDFGTPADLAVLPSGLVLIVDTVRHAVKVFDSEGAYSFSFGNLGAAPGQFAYPVAIAAGEGHRVFVAEKVGQRVQCLELFREERGRILLGAPQGAARSLRGQVLPPVGTPEGITPQEGNEQP